MALGERVTVDNPEDLRFIDLTAFADTVQDDVRFGKFVSAAELVRSYHAVNIDLNEALGCVDMMHRLIMLASANLAPAAWDSDQLVSMSASALLKQSLISYYRAAEGGAKGRKNTPFVESLNSVELQEAHARLLDQRNNAVAHYGRESVNPSQPIPFGQTTWNDDRLALVVERDGSAGLAFPWKRWNTRMATADDLKRCATAVQDTLLATRKRLEARIRRILRQDSELFKAAGLPKQVFDIEAFTVENPLGASEFRQHYKTSPRIWEPIKILANSD